MELEKLKRANEIHCHLREINNLLDQPSLCGSWALPLATLHRINDAARVALLVLRAELEAEFEAL